MGLPKCLKCGKYENRCPQHLLICREQEHNPQVRSEKLPQNTLRFSGEKNAGDIYNQYVS